MKYFVIKRTDQGGGYVLPNGCDDSYTKHLPRARRFRTVEEAERERCPENEIILSVETVGNGMDGNE